MQPEASNSGLKSNNDINRLKADCGSLSRDKCLFLDSLQFAFVLVTLGGSAWSTHTTKYANAVGG
jgi:hypothetical protein